MDVRNPKSTATILGHPIHPMLVPFPTAFLVGALLSDIGYWLTSDAFFATGTVYLLGAALVFAALAALAGITDFFCDKRVRDLSAARRHMIGNLTAVILALVNFVLRLGDTEAAVLPTGLILSAIVALILVYTGWQGGELVFRHRVGVSDERL